MCHCLHSYTSSTVIRHSGHTTLVLSVSSRQRQNVRTVVVREPRDEVRRRAIGPTARQTVRLHLILLRLLCGFGFAPSAAGTLVAASKLVQLCHGNDNHGCFSYSTDAAKGHTRRPSHIISGSLTLRRLTHSRTDQKFLEKCLISLMSVAMERMNCAKGGPLGWTVLTISRKRV